MNDLDDETSRTVVAHINPTAMAPREARHFISDVLSRHPSVETAKLVASELVTNAVRHGGQDAGDITVSVRPPSASNRRVKLTVSQVDHPGFSYDLQSSGHTSATGRGLMIVDAVASEWGVEEDGSVWAVLE